MVAGYGQSTPVSAVPNQYAAGPTPLSGATAGEKEVRGDEEGPDVTWPQPSGLSREQREALDPALLYYTRTVGPEVSKLGFGFCGSEITTVRPGSWAASNQVAVDDEVWELDCGDGPVFFPDLVSSDERLALMGKRPLTMKFKRPKFVDMYWEKTCSNAPGPVGIQFFRSLSEGGVLVVTQIAPGGWAEAAGLQLNDQILKINGASVRVYDRGGDDEIKKFMQATRPLILTVKRTNTLKPEDHMHVDGAEHVEAAKAAGKKKENSESEETPKAATGQKENMTRQQREILDPALLYYSRTVGPEVNKLGFVFCASEIIQVRPGSWAANTQVQVDDELWELDCGDGLVFFPDLSPNERLALMSKRPLTIKFKRPKYVDEYWEKTCASANRPLGVQVFSSQAAGALVVSQVVSGSWADTAGMQNKDRIVRLNGSPVKECGSEADIMKMLQTTRPLTLTTKRTNVLKHEDHAHMEGAEQAPKVSAEKAWEEAARIRAEASAPRVEEKPNKKAPPALKRTDTFSRNERMKAEAAAPLANVLCDGVWRFEPPDEKKDTKPKKKARSTAKPQAAAAPPISNGQAQRERDEAPRSEPAKAEAVKPPIAPVPAKRKSQEEGGGARKKVAPPARIKVTKAVKAGDKKIEVGGGEAAMKAQGLAIGMKVLIGPDPVTGKYEENEVIGFGSVLLRYPLQNSYGVGIQIKNKEAFQKDGGKLEDVRPPRTPAENYKQAEEFEEEDAAARKIQEKYRAKAAAEKEFEEEDAAARKIQGKYRDKTAAGTNVSNGPLRRSVEDYKEAWEEAWEVEEEDASARKIQARYREKENTRKAAESSPDEVSASNSSALPVAHRKAAESAGVYALYMPMRLPPLYLPPLRVPGQFFATSSPRGAHPAPYAWGAQPAPYAGEQEAPMREAAPVVEEAAGGQTRGKTAGTTKGDAVDVQAREAGAKQGKSIADLQNASAKQGKSIADLQNASAKQGKSVADLQNSSAKQGKAIADLQKATGEIENRITAIERRDNAGTNIESPQRATLMLHPRITMHPRISKKEKKESVRKSKKT